MKDLLNTRVVYQREDQRKNLGPRKKTRLNVEVEYEVYRQLKEMCYNQDISISEFTRVLLYDALKTKL